MGLGGEPSEQLLASVATQRLWIATKDAVGPRAEGPVVAIRTAGKTSEYLVCNSREELPRVLAWIAEDNIEKAWVKAPRAVASLTSQGLWLSTKDDTSGPDAEGPILATRSDEELTEYLTCDTRDDKPQRLVWIAETDVAKAWIKEPATASKLPTPKVTAAAGAGGTLGLAAAAALVEVLDDFGANLPQSLDGLIGAAIAVLVAVLGGYAWPDKKTLGTPAAANAAKAKTAGSTTS